MSMHLFSYLYKYAVFVCVPPERGLETCFLWLVTPGDTTRGVEKEEREGRI